jgi:hypothetical protein
MRASGHLEQSDRGARPDGARRRHGRHRPARPGARWPSAGPAFLYGARLEAVRRQAASDGRLIDPWYLAATIDGLRLGMDPYLRIIDRADILEKAKTARTLHQWIVEPDFDQEGEVQRAEAVLARQPALVPPLIAAAQGFRGWIEAGEIRPAMRSAMVRFWRKRQFLRPPVPLTGATALRSKQS